MQHKSTILIVDDDEINQEILGSILKTEYYNLVFANNGIDAVEIGKSETPDLILLDIMMPGMDGFDVCRNIRSDPRSAEIPIIMVTALDDHESRIRGVECGADDFITKPCERNELRARVKTITQLNRFRKLHAERKRFEKLIQLSPMGLLVVNSDMVIQLVNQAGLDLFKAEKESEIIGLNLDKFLTDEECNEIVKSLNQILDIPSSKEKFETQILRCDKSFVPVELFTGVFQWDGQSNIQILILDISERKAADARLNQSHMELKAAYDQTIEGWARALSLRDEETEEHSQRVVKESVRIADALGFSDREMEAVRRGALLHDIGKMGIPDHILRKPGSLTIDEFDIIKKHPVYAYNILRQINYLNSAVEIPYCHHEAWNGSGYPRGLAAEEIPLFARIFSVVDVWDALSNDRPYRKALPKEQVLKYLEDNAGVLFDPKIVELFLNLQISKDEADGS